MSFDERNAAWTGHQQRWFRQVHSRSSAPRIWGIFVRGAEIHTTWGQEGGQMQMAVETKQGVNIGKKNEVSPAAYALDRAKEMCRKKNWEGYREYSPEGFLDAAVVTDIDFDALPLSLCFYKPDNSMSAGMSKKAENREVLYTRKANGMALIIAKGKEAAKLYSRRMLRWQDDEEGQPGKTWDTRFAGVQQTADAIMPSNSILLGELVVRDADGKEDFAAIQSLTKSLTEQALEDVKALAAAGKKVAFYVWDIAFWDGVNMVSNSPVQSRYELIHEFCNSELLMPLEVFSHEVFPTPDHATKHAIANGWEGFVVVDPEGIYGDKGYNHKGKPDRPAKFCAKLKPEFEDDFIALWDPDKGYGERSTKGRYNLGIKSVALYQRNQKGELVFICNVSSGMTDDMKTNLADPKLWPQVWKVVYTERSYVSEDEKTNALIFPRINPEDCVRKDKKPVECINPRL